jgi:hypothetical protein
VVAGGGLDQAADEGGQQHRVLGEQAHVRDADLDRRVAAGRPGVEVDHALVQQRPGVDHGCTVSW